jgi:hypothetical protein
MYYTPSDNYTIESKKLIPLIPGNDADFVNYRSDIIEISILMITDYT